MKLDILSPEKRLFSGTVESVTMPGVLGSFTVLKNHAALISALQPGIVTYRLSDGEEQEVAINGGFAEVKNNLIAICAD